MNLEAVKKRIMDNADLILLMLISAVLVFYKISALPIIDGDTAYYSKVAKNIVESGNWLTFRFLNPADIIDKPPLAFWPIAVSFVLFGFTNFAVHIWHAFLSLGVVWLTFKIGNELFGRKIAFYSGLILITMLQFFYQTRIPMQDMLLVLLVGGAFFSTYLFSKYKKISQYYLAVLFSALSVLVKGPLGIALIAPVIFVYFIAIRTAPFNKLSQYIIHGITGLVLFFVVGGSWYLHQYFVWGQQFLDKYWIRNVGRYFGQIDKEMKVYRDYYTYFIFLLAATLPWGGFLYPSIYHAFKKIRENKKEFALLLTWFFVIILFFSLTGNNKALRYSLPVFPALAIMLGKLLNDIFEDPEKYKKIIYTSLGLTVLLTVPLILFMLYSVFTKFSGIFFDYFKMLIPFLITLCIALTAFIFLCLRKKLRTAFYTVIVLTCLSYVMLIHQTAKLLPQIRPYDHYSEIINSAPAKDIKVGYFKGEVPAFLIFSINSDVARIDSEKELAAFLTTRKKVFVISEDKKAFDEFRKKHKVNIIEENYEFSLFTN